MPPTRAASKRQKKSFSSSSSAAAAKSRHSIANTLNNSVKKRRTPTTTTTTKESSPINVNVVSTDTSDTPSDTSTGTIYFWKAEEKPYGIFCQWYPSPIEGPLLTFNSPTSSTPDPATLQAPITFNCCEQYMMAHKAHLFNPNDSTYLDEILSSSSPKEQRALGRKIPNFEEELWGAHRMNIVKQANYLKFTQDEELKRLLLDTEDRELVEASPRDRVWGVGFGAKNAEKNRGRWGRNLLGLALMDVRERIRKEEREMVQKKQ